MINTSPIQRNSRFPVAFASSALHKNVSNQVQPSTSQELCNRKTEITEKQKLSLLLTLKKIRLNAINPEKINEQYNNLEKKFRALENEIEALSKGCKLFKDEYEGSACALGISIRMEDARIEREVKRLLKRIRNDMDLKLVAPLFSLRDSLGSYRSQILSSPIYNLQGVSESKEKIQPLLERNKALLEQHDKLFTKIKATLEEAQLYVRAIDDSRFSVRSPV